MSKGQLVVDQAYKYLGVAETRTNRSSTIDRWAARWGMVAQPWCGIFADAMYAEAGVGDEGICHPATSEMCNRARARGAVWDGRGLVPPGSLWIKCGTHTAIVVKDFGNGNLLTIDGNSSNRVKENVRPRSGSNIMIAIPKEVREPLFKIVTKYYIEDTQAAPYVYRVAAGVPRWSTRAKAEAQIKKLLSSNPKKFAPLNPRVVKLGSGGFGIQLGSHRHYGAYLNLNKRDEHFKRLVDKRRETVGNDAPHGFRKYSLKTREKIS